MADEEEAEKVEKVEAPTLLKHLKPGDSGWIKPDQVGQNSDGSFAVNPDAPFTVHPWNGHWIRVEVKKDHYEIDRSDVPDLKFGEVRNKVHTKHAIDSRAKKPTDETKSEEPKATEPMAEISPREKLRRAAGKPPETSEPKAEPKENP